MTENYFPKCAEKGCNELAVSFSPHCWAHTDHKQYSSKLQAGIKAIGSEPFPLNLKKVECENMDFSHLNLSRSSFSQASISWSHFIGTNLAAGDMIGARFDSCDFVGSEMQDINLTRASFDRCSFSHADLKGAYLVEALFREADFMGAVLNDVVLWNADLSGAKHIKRKNFAHRDDGFARGKAFLSERNALEAFESYRTLKHYLYEKGLYEDASWASYRELTMERKYLFETRNPRYIPSLLMDILSGYTEKPNRVIVAALGTVFVFGAIYYLLDAVRSTTDAFSGAKIGLWDSIYFSFITFTTVGFGDFVPKANLWIKALVSLEAFSGPFMAGLYIFTLTRRYAAR